MKTHVKIPIIVAITIAAVWVIVGQYVYSSDDKLLQIQYACFIGSHGGPALKGHSSFDNGTHTINTGSYLWISNFDIQNAEKAKAEIASMDCPELAEKLLDGYFQHSPNKAYAEFRVENCKLIDRLYA